MIRYLAIFSCLFFYCPIAAAQDAGPTVSATDSIQSFRSTVKADKTALSNALSELRAEKKTKRKTRQLELSKAYLNHLIAARERIIAKIENSFSNGRCKNISSQAKTATLNETAEVKTNLANQKAEINNITQDQVRDLARRIIEENRVFMIVAPSVNEICSAQKIIYIIDNRITPLLTKVENQGKDLSEIKKYIDQAKTAAVNAYDLALSALQQRSTTPTDLVTQAREKIRNAKTALENARELIGLLVKATPTSTSATSD